MEQDSFGDIHDNINNNNNDMPMMTTAMIAEEPSTEDNNMVITTEDIAHTGHGHSHGHGHDGSNDHEEPFEPIQEVQEIDKIQEVQEIDKQLFSTLTLETLQQENDVLKKENHALGIQVHQLGLEINELHSKLGHVSDLDATTVVDADAAAQLSNYQSALTLSETQKSQLLHENHILRERCVQAGIPIADVVSSMVIVAPPPPSSSLTTGEQVAGTGAGSGGEGIHLGGNGEDVVLAQVGCGVGGDDDASLEQLDHADSQLQHTHDGVAEREEKPSRSQEKWESHFDRLVQYKNDHGNCLVPTSTELGRWLCRQRHNFKYKSLKEDRKQRLMALDKTCLGERVADLVMYSGVDGSSEYGINGGEDDKDGEEGLENGSGIDGNQVDSTTVENEGSTTAVSSATPPLMNAKTKYNYAYETKLHAKWNRFFKQLEEYKSENGHCNYPTMNGSLGRWISRQRTLYRSKKLKADRYEKLLSIGFIFEDATALEFRGKLDQQWDDMYNRLVEHKDSKGHCFDVPENLPLGKWLYRQRWLYRHGNLRKDRADKLLSIGFEDKKVLKRAPDLDYDDDDEEGMSGEHPVKKKRKVEAIGEVNDYEPGPGEEENALQQFDEDDINLSEQGKDTTTPSCGGVTSV
mmetsp:Transcript_11095/g.20761  ORF Transcript_11095/g.20761 Transcript_11095/m.20761 type:complete len:634 (+) Transcript_11095:533-2434(+)